MTRISNRHEILDISNGNTEPLAIESMATFTVTVSVVAAYEYCNLHGVWMREAAEA